MSTEVDLDRNSGLVSEGLHTFKLASSGEAMGSSGFPYWTFDAICQDPGPDQGKRIRLMVSLSPAARFKLDAFLDAVGAPRKGKARAEQFINKVLRGEVTTDVYKGQPQSVINNFVPAQAGTPAPAMAPQPRPEPVTTPESEVPEEAPAPKADGIPQTDSRPFKKPF